LSFEVVARISAQSRFRSSSLRGNLIRRYIRNVIIVTAVALFWTQAGAQRRGPSTLEERARAVQTPKSLQSDPLSLSLQQDREWVLKWLIEVPDISVKMCTTFFGDLGDSKERLSWCDHRHNVGFGSRFRDRESNKAKDVEAVYFAGVDGALHSYEAIHMKDASYHLPHLDDIIQKRDKGKLADYVHAAAKKCKS
jgi:hypothetical protein